MKKILVLFASTLSITIAAHPAAAATNGPVNMTVSSSSYNVYYTTVTYQTIVNNYSNPSFSSSTKAPTTGLDGIASAAPKFQQPWWGSPDDARTAALAWYNSSVWSTTPTGANDAVKLPNPSSESPYFAYGILNGSDVQYMYVDSTGTASPGSKDLSNTAYSYALAGVSN